MKLDELLSVARDGLSVARVFGEPCTQDGVTVIPAAKVMGGGGGGGGQDNAGQEGEGGGFGMVARPTGAFVIKNAEVRWVPAFDLNRAVLVAGVVALAALRLRRRARG
jgi:uncharacterized spore protein YtfJ